MMDKQKIEHGVRLILEGIGEDVSREGLKDTPARVARAYEEIFKGYTVDPKSVITVFSEDHKEMVIVKDIPFYSCCEHHMVPFHGKAFVGYIPNGKIVGLSKIARMIDLFSRRLQVQERLTSQVADALMELLEAKGVMVVVEAEHLCMSMRGVNKPGHSTVTSAVRGCFEEEKVRSEFLKLIK